MNADQPSERPLRILFVCGWDFSGPGEKQVLWLAEELLDRGHAVLISLRGDPATAAAEGADRLAGLDLSWPRFIGGRMRRRDRQAARTFRPDLIHASSARSPVAAAARVYSRETGAPVFIHWEDDEWGLTAGLPAGSGFRRLTSRLRRLSAVALPASWPYATPSTLAWAAREAVAHDAISPRLADHVRERTGRECAAILPVSPKYRGDAPAPELPASVTGSSLVAYTGAAHGGRVADIATCMRAVALCRKRGQDAAFVHAGGSAPGVSLAEMADRAGLSRERTAMLGHVPFTAIPALLRRCSVLVASGAPTDYNELGLPSKLQAYLASGRPVVTSAGGAGELLRDRAEVLKTHTADPSELADRIGEVLSDAELRETLAAGGVEASGRLFDPARNAKALIDHYRAGLERASGKRSES